VAFRGAGSGIWSSAEMLESLSPLPAPNAGRNVQIPARFCWCVLRKMAEMFRWCTHCNSDARHLQSFGWTYSTDMYTTHKSHTDKYATHILTYWHVHNTQLTYWHVHNTHTDMYTTHLTYSTDMFPTHDLQQHSFNEGVLQYPVQKWLLFLN